MGRRAVVPIVSLLLLAGLEQRRVARAVPPTVHPPRMKRSRVWVPRVVRRDDDAGFDLVAWDQVA